MENIYVTKAFLPPYEEYIEKIKYLWDNSKITNAGEYHNQLEDELAKYLKVSHLSLFTNGHMALELLLQSLELEGEVITTPYTFASTTHAIIRSGLKPVFCDIKEDDFTIDEKLVEDLITDKTVAILPVHVYGHVCNNDALERTAKRNNLKLIYDAAHAFAVEKDGESVIGYGDASILSFHATKVFNTVEGGAVVYHNEHLGRRLYGMRNFGIRNETTVDAAGANAKMDEFRAAMGLCNLKYIDDVIARRKIRYERYLYNLQNVDGVSVYSVPDNIKYNYAYFPVFIDQDIYGSQVRNQIYDYLRQYGIYTRKYFYPLITEMDCYRNVYDSDLTSVAKRISEGILTLPLYPDLEFDIIDRISELFIKCLSGRG